MGPVRRLHDRNRPAVWGLGVAFAYVGTDIGEAIGETTPAGIVVILLGVAAAIWSFVELGLLRGTDGENRFGPDPLGHDEEVAEVFD